MLSEALRAPFWIEVTSGLSYADYRCIDVYVRIGGANLPPPEYEAWYALTSGLSPMMGGSRFHSYFSMLFYYILFDILFSFTLFSFDFYVI